MNLGTLGRLIDWSLAHPVPQSVRALCADYYAPYYSLFFRVIALMRDGLAVELGVEKARGSGCLAAGSPNVVVVGVDHTRRDEVAAVQARYPNFTFLEQPSLPVPDAIHVMGGPIDVLHVDTEHSYAMAREEFNAYKPLLAPGALVCFDDLHAMEDDVLKYFMSLPYPKIHDDRLHPGTGFGALIYTEGT